jgi:hypothetical protein
MKCRPILYRPAKLPAHLNLHTINFLSFLCVVVGVDEVLHIEFYLQQHIWTLLTYCWHCSANGWAEMHNPSWQLSAL